MPTKTKLFLVDDHHILIDGIRNMLDEKEYTVVATAADYDSTVNLLHNTEIDILISDIELPGKDGIELIKYVKTHFPAVKIVVLSMHDERCIVEDAVRLGINAYCLKNITQQQFLNALNKVKAEKFYISEDISYILAESLQNKTDQRLLSEREIEIIKLIAKEYSNKQIADTLFISERTVETHRKNIFRKTNSQSVVGLIKYAIEHKII